MDYIILFNCLILLSVLTSTINPLDRIHDSDYLDEIINEEPENIQTFYRDDRSTLFPRVGRSDQSKLNKRIRRILMNNPKISLVSPKRTIQIMPYEK
ncbi:hypothetical protein MN116_005745 [Schistosoma mekongi]|uniref:Uncharacterized protein n=1 Tax=Schistosoma mekongi TaxID=38744 RepID=A0AAE1ZB54_SCHME|nr:hypothetical protein MN116_005745 [Schistosoma mekongi]